MLRGGGAALIGAAFMAGALPQAASAQSEEAEAEAVEADAAPEISPPVLIEFTGVRQLGRALLRERVLSQVLGYTLTVGPDGTATECELSRDFRRLATKIAICRPLMRYMRFEPARDADGNAVVGTYSNTIAFLFPIRENR